MRFPLEAPILIGMRILLTMALVALVGCDDGSSADASVSGDGGADAGVGRDSGPLLDGGGGSDAGPNPGDAGACVRARLLWSDDFETGDYSRWTSMTYGGAWGDDCQSNGFSTDHAVSGSSSHRSEIVCAYSASHRGYGGVQFDGDTVVPAYTNTGTGIDAPYGVVNTYWSWLETSYAFEAGRWFSFWTINTDCGWAEDVITLGLEDTSWRLTPAHILNTGGTVDFEAGAPAFPRGEWVRTTLYVNTADGVMHIWQNGQSLLHATFTRPSTDICQWHWGAYASGDNTDVVLYEDDNSIHRLEEPWVDFAIEPWLGQTIPVCE